MTRDQYERIWVRILEITPRLARGGMEARKEQVWQIIKEVLNV